MTTADGLVRSVGVSPYWPDLSGAKWTIRVYTLVTHDVLDSFSYPISQLPSSKPNPGIRMTIEILR